MKERIILVGKSASGKDHARYLYEKMLGIKYVVSYTTRPPRANETHGIDYFFISEEEFVEMIREDKWHEYTHFNGWYYGRTREQFDERETVFIMTPTGLKNLTPEERLGSMVIYFDIPDSIRRERMEARKGNADNVERRLAADNEDFRGFRDYDVRITDPNFTLEDLEMHVC